MAPIERSVLVEMFLETLQALDLDVHLRKQVSVQERTLEIRGQAYRLDDYSEILVVAFGKAAPRMAITLKTILGTAQTSGVVVSNAPAAQRVRSFEYRVSGHPYPNPASLAAAERILQLLFAANEQTLVVFLISGGGSALVEQPLFNDITLPDLVAFHHILVSCGATISEMNVLRKHFSATKGGRLALAAYPARQATIYVSDVPPDQPSAVASGPTMPDESTVDQCLEIVDRYGLMPQLPDPYRRRLKAGAIPETPKPGDPRFDNSQYCSVLSNADALDALARLARERGWDADIDVACDDSPVEVAADYLLTKLRALKAAAGRTVAVISGGELSSPVRGPGRGGRNQAFALACALRIEGEPIAVLSAGTDGIDGNSPAAGAVADGSTIARARALGQDPARILRRSDSYRLFAARQDAIITGPTGNNVRDVRILVM
ncbi:MAG TPA: DUF4147 domain-containing protein [Chloroflexota bacterium]